MKPHIAVNTRLLLPGKLEGIGRFSYEVLNRLVEGHREVDFSFFFDRPFNEEFVFGENVRPYVVYPQARHMTLWYAWFHWQMPRMISKVGAQLFFSPEFFLAEGATVPQVPVFHDLAYEHFPYDIDRLSSWYYRKYSPRFAKLAAHIITVSEYSKSDIEKTYGIAGEDISVVFNGAGELFKPISKEERQLVRQKFSQGFPFFHFVGAIQPRKNVENLLRAFDQFKLQTDSPARLLIVGRKGWQYERAEEVYDSLSFKEHVIFTGYVNDEELAAIYASSIALCYVPYLEGFGIPIIEAMRSESAVICSNITSMPEVGGDAAIQVPPFDIDAISAAMTRLEADPAYRSERIEQGRIQSEKFSWEKTADKVWKVLESKLG